jgi:hypothetical protein
MKLIQIQFKVKFNHHLQSIASEMAGVADFFKYEQRLQGRNIRLLEIAPGEGLSRLEVRHSRIRSSVLRVGRSVK